MGLAFQLSTSVVARDRVGGAGLLGLSDSHRSRETLYELLENGENSSIRDAALRSLGRVGNRDTLEYLKRTLEDFTSTGNPIDHYRIKLDITSAIGKLSKRFP